MRRKDKAPMYDMGLLTVENLGAQGFAFGVMRREPEAVLTREQVLVLATKLLAEVAPDGIVTVYEIGERVYRAGEDVRV